LWFECRAGNPPPWEHPFDYWKYPLLDPPPEKILPTPTISAQQPCRLRSLLMKTLKRCSLPMKISDTVASVSILYIVHARSYCYVDAVCSTLTLVLALSSFCLLWSFANVLRRQFICFVPDLQCRKCSVETLNGIPQRPRSGHSLPQRILQWQQAIRITVANPSTSLVHWDRAYNGRFKSLQDGWRETETKLLTWGERAPILYHLIGCKYWRIL